MQKNTRKKLKEIVKDLKTYLQEAREEDFWHFKEILVNKKRSVKADLKRQTGKANFERQTLKADSKGQTVKADFEKELNALYERIKDCKKCELSRTRIKVVFSRGSLKRGIMFIGEAPGYAEDRQGLPFVGRAGQLLDEILASVGLKKEEVYITNVVKCHPLLDPSKPEQRGNDRQPNREEIATCIPILKEQITLLKPKIICTLGAVATNALLGKFISLTKIRGKFYPFRVPFGPETLRVEGNPLQGEPFRINLQSESYPYGETRLFPTFHPAAILRMPSLKDVLVNDLKKLSTELK